MHTLYVVKKMVDLEKPLKSIVVGTTIIFDCWAVYNTLKNHVYQHLTVNHSQTFKDT